MADDACDIECGDRFFNGRLLCRHRRTPHESARHAAQHAAETMAAATRRAAELEEWKRNEQAAVLAIAAELIGSGHKGDGIVDGVKFVVAKLEKAKFFADAFEAWRVHARSHEAPQCDECRRLFEQAGKAHDIVMAS